MSLHKRLYDTFKLIRNCDLVLNGVVTDESLARFEVLLNEAQPLADELLYHKAVKDIYHCNPDNFYKYLSNSRNNAGALVLWTEKKCIVRYFRLFRKCHLTWNRESKTFTVAQFDATRRVANQARVAADPELD